MSNPTFPRQVIVSPGYGLELYGWEFSDRENPRLIALVVTGCTDPATWAEALGLDGYHDFGIVVPYSCDGRPTLEIVVVHGPYVIEEHDGSESVMERDSIAWRE